MWIFALQHDVTQGIEHESHLCSKVHRVTCQGLDLVRGEVQITHDAQHLGHWKHVGRSMRSPPQGGHVLFGCGHFPTHGLTLPAFQSKN